MQQSTTPSLSQTIWPRWASTQFLSLTIVQTLLPVTFAYYLSSEAVLWDNWGDERGYDEGHWHTHTKELPWGLPKIFGTVQQVHCSRRLLWRGLEFHVSTINKSAHRKKVWKLIVCPSYFWKVWTNFLTNILTKCLVIGMPSKSPRPRLDHLIVTRGRDSAFTWFPFP